MIERYLSYLLLSTTLSGLFLTAWSNQSSQSEVRQIEPQTASPALYYPRPQQLPERRISALDPRFGCHANGFDNDYSCLHAATEYLEAMGGGTLYLPDIDSRLPRFTGQYICGLMQNAGYHNGCIEITSKGNITVEFAPTATLVMKNLLNGRLDGTYHGIFVGDPTFSHRLSDILILNPHIVWSPAPLRRTQGDGIHIVGSTTRSLATKNVTVINGEVENAPQVGYGAFGTIEAALINFQSINSFGNGSIFSSTWAGSIARRVSCKWTSNDIGDDCVEATAYYSLLNPAAPFVYDDGREPFNSPDHTTRNNNGIKITDVRAVGGLADGVRLAGCYECSVDGVSVTGKSVAGVILDSSISGSVYLASIRSTVTNVYASQNKENFYLYANGPINHRGELQGIGILATGSQYTKSPICTVTAVASDATGSGATCAVTVKSGAITSISFSPGSGYSLTPTVTISDPSGHGASLQATLSNDFLNFEGDYATNLKLVGGFSDNLLAVGGIYGFSIGEVIASNGQIRLNSAHSYTLESLDCNCKRVYISGDSTSYPSPIDETTPWHNIILGKIINHTGSVEIHDTRGLSIALLESAQSERESLYLSRVLDANFTTVKIENANRANRTIGVSALVIGASHRIRIEKLEIHQDSNYLAPLDIGGGSRLDVSEDIQLRDIAYSASNVQFEKSTLMQTGPFAPVRIALKLRTCDLHDANPHWKYSSIGILDPHPSQGETCNSTSPVKLKP